MKELKKKRPVRFGTGNRCIDEERAFASFCFSFCCGPLAPPSSSAGDSCSFGVEGWRVSENHAIMSAISGGSYRRVQERPINLELQAGPSI